LTENGSNYTVTVKQTAGLNKLNCTIYNAKYKTFRYNITHTFSIGLKLFTI